MQTPGTGAYAQYREKYLNAPKLNLDRPVDVSLELSSFCNMHCNYCAAPDTLVIMMDYTVKPIQEIVSGEHILAFEEFPIMGSRLMRAGLVEKVWVTRKDAVTITAKFLDSVHKSITCSLDHKFLIGDKWVEARDLEVGGRLEHFSGSFIGCETNHLAARIVSIESVGEIDLIDIQTSTRTFYGNGFATHNCYHADKKNLPFRQRVMPWDTFKKIIDQAAELGVHSVKTNWRGESTLNPSFAKMTAYVKERASGSTFIDRLTNSNFKFANDRDDIFQGLCNQTKVKVSYDSFRADVFEGQRAGGDHALTTANIDRFYNWRGRNNIIVIQAVRTSRNRNEDIEGEAKKRWPSALISIRDMVEGRVEKDLSQIKARERDFSERQSCIQAHARLIFNWNGEAVPCCPDIREDLKIGSIHEKTVYEIFNDPKVKRLREDLLSLKAFENSPCRGCSSYETTRGFVPSLES